VETPMTFVARTQSDLAAMAPQIKRKSESRLAAAGDESGDDE
jgi:hypothetical protein